MPLFRFQALLVGGRKTSGVIEADSLSAAKERLRLEQMIITNISPHDQTKKKWSIPFIHFFDMTRMMGQLLKAGIPLYEAMVIIEEKYRKMPFHPILIDLCDHVKKGEALSAALSRHSAIFDPIYVATVKAGEQSGALKEAFEHLAALLDDRNRLKQQLFSAAAYPLFLAVFCLIVFLSLLTWVIPSLKNLFDGRALHPLSQFVFKLSDLFLDHALLIAIGSILFALFLCVTLTHPRLRPIWDFLLIKLPLIGPLTLLAATVRLCRTCHLLLEGSSQLLKSLELARGTLKNQILERSVLQVEKAVSEGAPLSLQIEKIGWMPPLASRMLAVGEQTGQMASMFHHIAALSEAELSRLLRRYTALLQPLLLLLLGLLIGTVVLSILIPLTDVGSILQE